MKITDDTKDQFVIHLPDTRGVVISHFGKGNLKIGANVYTFSRVPANRTSRMTCPGATDECIEICYAARVVGEWGVVYDVWSQNSLTDDIPDVLPVGCKLLRLHIGGDFSSVSYIRNWIELLRRHPDITVWAYTRSWRVSELLPVLEELRTLPNVQLFASMDKSTVELPPEGWRVAWLQDDKRAVGLVCPEEIGKVESCEKCGYCFRASHRKDVIFIPH